MRLNEGQRDFIKTHQGMIRQILEGRLQDYMNGVVDEPDPQKKEVLSLVAKEFRRALVTLGNVTSEKQEPEKTDDFTGI